MKLHTSSLRRRMLLTLLCCFLPMVAVISVLFAETISSQQRTENEALRYTAQDISQVLDRYIMGVYSVSDAFSSDQNLIALIDRDYTGRPVARQWAITYANRTLFESYNRLLQQKKIDAIYLSNRRDVFDFLDPNQSVPYLVQQLEAMGVQDMDKMGRFCTYPLRDNFLKTEVYNLPRRDSVVFGSRRVYSALKSGYPYVHIFAIEEQDLYTLYELTAKRQNAQVYIMDSSGGLISSTDESAVAAHAVPQSVLSANSGMGDAEYHSLNIDGRRCNAARTISDTTGWTTLVLVSGDALTASTSALYLKILAVILICLAVFLIVLVYFYKRFMAPMAQLEQAMREADAGNLQAYAKPQGPDEIAQMMHTYNTMLDSIKVGLDRQIELERHRQDLEMQVLMSQINPHFLYNTLETIVWKAGEAGRSDIGKLAASLGKLYRLSIVGGLFVALQQELDHVKMYMNIQQSRYGNKVAYDVRLHGIDAAEAETLKLTLQPIVENCLLYGMEGLDRTLRIRVSARRSGDSLVLAVTDNGAGISEDALAELRQQIKRGRKNKGEKNRRSTGIGLHNIYARLQLYAGADSSLDIYSIKGMGTQVSITLPQRGIAPEESE